MGFQCDVEVAALSFAGFSFFKNLQLSQHRTLRESEKIREMILLSQLSQVSQELLEWWSSVDQMQQLPEPSCAILKGTKTEE